MSNQQKYYTELNRHAWDKKTISKFDDPDFKALGRLSVMKYLTLTADSGKVQKSKVAEYNLQNVNDIKLAEGDINEKIWPLSNHIRVLDFACGAGNVSLALAELLPNKASYEIVGVDLSEDLVDSYNERVPAKIGHAKALDLISDEFDEKDFDVAICSMSLHHIADLDALFGKIASHLKKNGWFLVMDFDGHAPHSEQEAKSKGIAHCSLDPIRLSNSFEDSGLENTIVQRGFKYVFSEEHEKRKAEEDKKSGHAHHHFGNFNLAIVAGQRN